MSSYSFQMVKRPWLGFPSATVVVLFFLMGIGQGWARETPAPVVEASGVGGGASQQVKDLEARVARLERLLENRALVEMVMRVDGLQNEVQRMLGQVEEQGYTLDGIKKRQRDLYLDIDQRLQKLEEARAAMPSPGMSGFVPAPVIAVGGVATATTGQPPSVAVSADGAPLAGDNQIDPQQERAAYERAFNLLKEGRYDLAVAAFNAFVATYPKGRYADNAQYWLGEANYVQRNFKIALAEFKKVVKNFPTSPKRADALLKLGYTQQELGRYDQARVSMNTVLMSYPNTTAASLAQRRLQELKQLK
ncbi:MAG: tol-pal system protein YbgF [Gammaproteobacteria bacterium]|nr:tol-pal system protein YbgF [Gammaproteobacteria bacterium]